MRLWAAFAVIAAFFVLTPAAGAQSAPEIVDGGVTNLFPDGMEFAVSVSSDSPIEDLRLRYTVLPDGTAAIGRPEFDAGTTVETIFTLAGNN
ncbi:MAG: hypothetical protein IIA90_08160, partial [Chloroflexi bacterium]|nr:hypothetical protein [Chloroflexota bacterium]